MLYKKWQIQILNLSNLKWLLFVICISISSLAAAASDWKSISKKNISFIYNIAQKQKVIEITDNQDKFINWPDGTTLIASGGKNYVVKKHNLVTIFTNFTEIEIKLFLQTRSRKSAWNVLFLNEAYAGQPCDLRSGSAVDPSFIDQLEWGAVNETVKKCSTQILEKSYDQFVDHVSEMYESLKAVVDNPKKFFTELIQNLSHLDQELVQGIKNFFSLIEDLGKLGVEAIKGLACQLIGDFTSQIVVGLSTGPSGMISISKHLHTFFERIRGYKEFIDVVKNNRGLQSSLIYYARDLEQLKTHLKLKTSGKFTSNKNLNEHYEKHQKEFGSAKSAEEYEQKAIAFVESRKGLFIIGLDKDAKWDPKTGEMIVLNKKGQIITYYIHIEMKTENPLESLLRKPYAYIQKFDIKKALPPNTPGTGTD